MHRSPNEVHKLLGLMEDAVIGSAAMYAVMLHLSIQEAAAVRCSPASLHFSGDNHHELSRMESDSCGHACRYYLLTVQHVMLTTCKQTAPPCTLDQSELETSLALDVMSAICRGRKQLGTALQRPGMMATMAAIDPDAAPALCILVLATHDSYTVKARVNLGRMMRSLPQPATTECLRYAQTNM